jgi:hypothetical protein
MAVWSADEIVRKRGGDPLAGLEVRDVQANRTNQDAQNSDSLDDSGSNSS